MRLKFHHTEFKLVKLNKTELDYSFLNQISTKFKIIGKHL